MSDLLQVYNKMPVDVEHASGQYIWDKAGKRYTDFLSGISVTNMGHNNAAVIEAVKKAVNSYMHVSNLFHDHNQEELASELIRRSFPGKVFFTNSGAEANECAIKTARQRFGGKKYEVISFANSFHGRTLATLAATGQKKFTEKLGPMPEGFVHAEYNFLASVEDKINDKTCAVLLEFVQGEGGVVPASESFVKGLRELCDAKNLLLIADEIQTGLGRTGKLFAYENYGIKPDIMTLGKALGGGLPLGAALISDEVASYLSKGDHGSTFGGNPVSCAASLALIQQIDDKMLSYINREGEIIVNGLRSLSKRYSSIKEIRHLGMMVAAELSFKGQELVDYVLERGFIINCTQDRVIRFLPPFTIRGRDIEELIGVLDDFFKERH